MKKLDKSAKILVRTHFANREPWNTLGFQIVNSLWQERITVKAVGLSLGDFKENSPWAEMHETITAPIAQLKGDIIQIICGDQTDLKFHSELYKTNIAYVDPRHCRYELAVLRKFSEVWVPNSSCLTKCQHWIHPLNVYIVPASTAATELVTRFGFQETIK